RPKSDRESPAGCATGSPDDLELEDFAGSSCRSRPDRDAAWRPTCAARLPELNPRALRLILLFHTWFKKGVDRRSELSPHAFPKKSAEPGRFESLDRAPHRDRLVSGLPSRPNDSRLQHDSRPLAHH